jgi:hypothetical protein
LTFLPKGPDAWNALYLPSTPESLLTARNTVITGVLDGFLRGDYRPMYEAYARRVPLEVLEERGRGVLAEMKDQLGSVRGYEILGSGPLVEGVATFVRIDGDRGVQYRQYIWKPEGGLLGYRLLPWLQLPAFFPVAPDRFQAWGSRLSIPIPVGFERGPDRRQTLVLGEGAAAPRLPRAADR